MEFVGRLFKKQFKGPGVVTGYVNSYDASSGLFTALYEDGNTEELGLSELSLLITGENSFDDQSGSDGNRKRQKKVGREEDGQNSAALVLSSGKEDGESSAADPKGFSKNLSNLKVGEANEAGVPAMQPQRKEIQKENATVVQMDTCRPPNPPYTSTKRRKQTAFMVTKLTWKRSSRRPAALSAQNHVSTGEMAPADNEVLHPSQDSDNGGGGAGGVSREHGEFAGIRNEPQRKDLFSEAEKTESNKSGECSQDDLIREAVSCQPSKGGDSEELNLKTAEIDNNKLELE